MKQTIVGKSPPNTAQQVNLSSLKSVGLKCLYVLTCIMYIATKAIPTKETIKRALTFVFSFALLVVISYVMLILFIRAVDIEYEQRHQQNISHHSQDNQ